MSETTQRREYECDGFKFDVWGDEGDPSVLWMKLRDPDPQATYKYKVATIRAVQPPAEWHGNYSTFDIEWDEGEDRIARVAADKSFWRERQISAGTGGGTTAARSATRGQLGRLRDDRRVARQAAGGTVSMKHTTEQAGHEIAIYPRGNVAEPTWAG